MGLGLQQGERWDKSVKNNLSPVVVLCLNKIGEGWNSPFRVWDRANRCWYTRRWYGATNSRGTLDYTAALHRRGASNQTGAPRICRKGFLRWTGLLQLLRKMQMCHDNNTLSPPGGSHSQTITGQVCWPGPPPLWPQGSPAHADERNCHVVLICSRLSS